MEIPQTRTDLQFQMELRLKKLQKLINCDYLQIDNQNGHYALVLSDNPNYVNCIDAIISDGFVTKKELISEMNAMINLLATVGGMITITNH